MANKVKVFWVIVAAVLLAALTSVLLLSRWDAPPSRKVEDAEPPAEEIPRPEPDRPLALPPTTPMPGAPRDRIQSIDRLLEQMDVGRIAFNAPDSINVNDTAIIHLVLGVSQEMEELKQRIEAEGDRVGDDVRVSDRMEARLTGPSFAITAITPELQAVSQTQITEWRWEVEPQRVGSYSLHLTLSAIISLDGTSVPRAIRTFDKVIEVEVTWPQRVSSFVGNNWQWLWAAVLVPLAGWFWRNKKKSKAS